VGNFHGAVRGAIIEATTDGRRGLAADQLVGRPVAVIDEEDAPVDLEAVGDE